MLRFQINLKKDLDNIREWCQKDNVYLLMDGEIYVPEKIEQSDILGLYLKNGLKFVHQLNGKFVFIIYDERSNFCHVIRDRTGECNVYFSGPTIFNYIRDFDSPKTWQDNPEDWSQTNWKEIHQVPPGNILSINLNNLQYRLNRYWTPWRTIKDIPTKELINKIEETLIDAIRIRKSNDCAVVCGGLDTSITAGILQTKEIYSFHNGFSQELSDVPYVKAMAEHLEAKLNWAHCTHEQFNKIFDDLLLDTDILIPFNGGHVIHYAVGKKIVESDSNIRAVFTGTGGDDLFGYIRTGIIAYELKIYDNQYFKTWNRVLDNYYQNHVQRLITMYGFNSTLFKSYTKYDILEEVMGKIHLGIFENIVPLEALMIRKSYARHNLETRSPFLDYRVAELAFSYNKMLDYKDGGPKYLLREAMKKYLPSKVNKRKHKVGHSVPVKEWLGVNKPAAYYKKLLISNFSS